MTSDTPTLGLALSGGGARGFFHCGVIDALQSEEVAIHGISGTSAGALVGALYAAGVPMRDAMDAFPSRLRTLFLGATSWVRLRFDPVSVLHDYLYPYLRDLRFDDLNTRLYISAVDAGRGQMHVFGQDNEQVLPAVLASCAIPGLLNYHAEDGRLYFDGGLLQNLPAQVIRSSVDQLVGVDLFPFHERSYDRVPSRAAILRRSADILQAYHARAQHPLCDLLISPRRLIKYQTYSLSNKTALYDLGMEEMSVRIRDGQLLL